MKCLVVFYSLSGHTRLIADLIAGETGADVIELVPVKPSAGKSGFSKYFLGGMHASLSQKPALKNPLPKLNDYELIFIGTPVWASQNAPAINTFISGSNLTSKKIMLFASSAGGDAGKCFEKLKSRLPGSKILGEIGFKEAAPDQRESIEAKIKVWLAAAGL